MELFSHINYWAVLVSAVVYYVIGYIWYTPLFGKSWSKETGVSMNGQSTPPVLPMMGQFIATLIFSLGIFIALAVTHKTGILPGIITATGVIVFFLLPINSSTWFFKGKPLLFWIEFGYQSIGALAIGIIAGLWR